MKTAITFISHGSSKPEYRDFVTGLVARVGLNHTVNVGFLDMLKPTIPEAIEHQLQAGADTIRLLPLFLGPGKHISTDIPRIVADVQNNHPHVKLILEDYLGRQEGYEEMLKKWVAE